jgi:hypothetical protein
VTLALNAKAEIDGTVLFNVELVYGGVFRIDGFPQEHMLPILFIECPRLLFPFARQVVADATRQGGFPPLMIDPIDFAQMFQQRMAQEQAKAKSGQGGRRSRPAESFATRPGSRRTAVDLAPERLVAELRHQGGMGLQFRFADAGAGDAAAIVGAASRPSWSDRRRSRSCTSSTSAPACRRSARYRLRPASSESSSAPCLVRCELSIP